VKSQKTVRREVQSQLVPPNGLNDLVSRDLSSSWTQPLNSSSHLGGAPAALDSSIALTTSFSKMPESVKMASSCSSLRLIRLSTSSSNSRSFSVPIIESPFDRIPRNGSFLSRTPGYGSWDRNGSRPEKLGVLDGLLFHAVIQNAHGRMKHRRP